MQTADRDNAILAAARRYPQLLLPIGHGIKDTEEYRDAVLRGKPVCAEPDFIGSSEDSLHTVDTPVGRAEILCLAEREDFEHALRALAYRCENVEILPSVGANTIRGLINWEKLRKHKLEYIASGGQNWSAEFRSFTSDKSNYIDSLILLSSGYYSALSPDEAGLPEREWKESSIVIRKYHELTHFVCRALHPDDIEPIRDEVAADAVGLFAAFGTYDRRLAERFLGIEGGKYKNGGRLAHYIGDESAADAVLIAETQIKELAAASALWNETDISDLMLRIIDESLKR